MEISMSKTREQFPLSYKKIIKKTIVNTIAYTIFFLFLFALPLTFIVGVWIEKFGSFGIVSIATVGFLSFMILISMLSYFYQRWYFAVYFYDLTNDFIQIKKGPITPREITIPYERLQDVYVDQDLLDRIFGLYDVHLSSATVSSGMEAHIDGVEKQSADGLRAILLQTIKERISKNRGQNVISNSPVTQNL